MAGIPAKCYECGQILQYDGSKWIYFCPDCETKKAERTIPRELKKAA